MGALTPWVDWMGLGLERKQGMSGGELWFEGKIKLKKNKLKNLYKTYLLGKVLIGCKHMRNEKTCFLQVTCKLPLPSKLYSPETLSDILMITN